MSEYSVELKGLNKVYSNLLKEDTIALKDINLQIRPGEFISIIGPSGCGKSTLLRIIGNLDKPTSGTIEYRDGADQQMGFVFQDSVLLPWKNVRQNAEFPLVIQKKQTKENEEKLDELLELAGLSEFKTALPRELSGGMKQRIGIAQTLLNLPRILVVDEPTAGLDPRERIRFRNLLVELSRNRIVIFSTHIIEDIASSCNQVGVINKGSLKYHGTPSEMVGIAKDVTWVFEVSLEEFAQLPPELLIVHHIRMGESIRVRCLSETQPVPNAVRTNPVLEDSYLWLLRGVKLANNEQIITQ